MGDSTTQFRVLAEDRGAVRLLTLDRPAKLNAFTPDGFRLLAETLEAAAADPGVAVCVLTGNGRAFSAGVDLSVIGRPGGSAELGRWFDPLMTHPGPIPQAAPGRGQRAGGRVRVHAPPALRSGDGRRGRPVPAALRRPRHQRRSSQQLALAAPGGHAAGHLDGPVGSALRRRRGRGHRVRPGQAPAGRAVARRCTGRNGWPSTASPALVVNKRLLRHGWADHLAEVWQREKAAMLAIADQVGPIGWSGDGGD